MPLPLPFVELFSEKACVPDGCEHPLELFIHDGHDSLRLPSLPGHEAVMDRQGGIALGDTPSLDGHQKIGVDALQPQSGP